MNLAARSHALTALAEQLCRIEQHTSLATPDFCRAILHLAQNDALLKAAIERSRMTAQVPDPSKPDMDIASALPGVAG